MGIELGTREQNIHTLRVWGRGTGLFLGVLGVLSIALWWVSRDSDPHGGVYALIVGVPAALVGGILILCTRSPNEQPDR